jgi:WD40 repeat protein
MNRFLTILIIFISIAFSQSIAQQLDMKELWKKTSEFEEYFAIEKSKTSDNLFLLRSTKFGGKISKIEEWDPNTNLVVNTFQISSPISSITSEPTGKYLICTYFLHQFVFIIDLTTGESRLQTLPVGGAYTGYLKTVMLPQGQYYAAYEYNSKKIYLVNIENSYIDKEYVLTGIEGSVYYSRDGSYFAYYTSDKKIVIRYLPSGIETATFDVAQKPYSMDFVDLNNLIVSFNKSTVDSKIISYDAFTGNENFSFDFGESNIFVAESGDLDWIYISSISSGNLYVYNKTQKDIKTLGYDLRSSISLADNASDWFYTINRDGNLEIYSAETLGIVKTKEILTPTMQKYVTSVKILPNLKYVLTAGDDGDLIFHHPLTGDFVHRIYLDMEPIRSLDISEDSKRVIVSDVWGSTKIVNIENLEQSIVEREYNKDSYLISRFLDEETFIVGGTYKGLLLVNDQGEKNIMPENKYFTPLDIAISPDKNKIVMSTFEQKLVIFTRNSSTENFAYEAEFWADSAGGGIKSVRFSKDGNYLITSSSMFKSRIWDAHTYELERAYESIEGNRDKTITSSILSNDGQFIFHCDAIPTLRVFHRPNGFILDQKLNLAPDTFLKQSMMDLSSDGNWLIIVTGSGTFYLFDVYGTTSISEHSNGSENIKIFPNPTTHFINVEIVDGIASWESKNAQIFNILGEPVMDLNLANITENGGKIDVSHLSSEVYYLRIGKITKTFVKY